MAVFAYLALQLCRAGAKNIIEAQDRIYFKHNDQTYYVEEVSNYWTLIGYTYQHNAPSILNSAQLFTKGDWSFIIKMLDSPI